MAESVLVDVLEQKGWDYDREEGEAAFYGPKIDIKLIDALGRSWQLSTFQFDFNLPSKFDVNFIGSDSKPHNVVMVHRALLGSLERFVGILTEHFGGAFPVWLAPIQAMVIPVSEKHTEYAIQLENQLKNSGFRAKADLRNEKMGYKIRDGQLRKIPFMLIVGDREVEEGNLSVRNRFEGDKGKFSVSDFEKYLSELIESKAVRP
jgi:threonyl-tRNA synthetase